MQLGITNVSSHLVTQQLDVNFNMLIKFYTQNVCITYSYLVQRSFCAILFHGKQSMIFSYRLKQHNCPLVSIFNVRLFPGTISHRIHFRILDSCMILVCVTVRDPVEHVVMLRLTR